MNIKYLTQSLFSFLCLSQKAKEILTESNIPHGNCVICLYGFKVSCLICISISPHKMKV